MGSSTAKRVGAVIACLGLSQESFAKVIGEEFPQKYVSRLKRGERSLQEDESEAILDFLIDPSEWLKSHGPKRPECLPIVAFPWGEDFGEDREAKLRELVEGMSDPTISEGVWNRLLFRCSRPGSRKPFQASELLSLDCGSYRQEDPQVISAASIDTRTQGFPFVQAVLLGGLPEFVEVTHPGGSKVSIRRTPVGEGFQRRSLELATATLKDLLNKAVTETSQDFQLSLIAELNFRDSSLKKEAGILVGEGTPQEYLLEELLGRFVEDEEKPGLRARRPVAITNFLSLLVTLRKKGKVSKAKLYGIVESVFESFEEDLTSAVKERRDAENSYFESSQSLTDRIISFRKETKNGQKAR